MEKSAFEGMGVRYLPQDQFVDNRTTRSDVAEFFDPSLERFRRMGDEQGLVDNSLMFAPASAFAKTLGMARGARTAANLARVKKAQAVKDTWAELEKRHARSLAAQAKERQLAIESEKAYSDYAKHGEPGFGYRYGQPLYNY
jgi:hypothetical protein